jgi:hypothetical protein
MVGSKMLLVAEIDQSIIPSLSIRMDDTFKLYTPPDDPLKRLSGAIGTIAVETVPFHLKMPKTIVSPRRLALVYL